MVAAQLLGIELHELIDTAVAESETDGQLRDTLARPPFEFSRLAADAVLGMRIRDRTPRRAAALRAELEQIDRDIKKADS